MAFFYTVRTVGSSIYFSNMARLCKLKQKICAIFLYDWSQGVIKPIVDG